MRILRELFLIPVYIYKGVISPFLPHTCRYTPSCSSYMMEAVKRFGVIKGGAMGVVRIARCHNGFFGGPDPVPAEADWAVIKRDWQARRKPKGFDKEFKKIMKEEEDLDA